MTKPTHSWMVELSLLIVSEAGVSLVLDNFTDVGTLKGSRHKFQSVEVRISVCWDITFAPVLDEWPKRPTSIQHMTSIEMSQISEISGNLK